MYGHQFQTLNMEDKGIPHHDVKSDRESSCKMRTPSSDRPSQNKEPLKADHISTVRLLLLFVKKSERTLVEEPPLIFAM